jgi:NAD-dependent deacetylase
MALSAADDRAIDAVIGRLRPGQRLLFITGAGLSADSGLPTYRGIGGLYDQGAAEPGLRIEEILSGPMLRVRPELTWKHLLDVARACRGSTFNRGHEVIAALERDFEVCVLTQNVDGFHRAAGSRNVIDIHGDLHVILCTARSCGYREEVEAFEPAALPPRCPRCAAVLRPDVVLFGEWLPPEKVARLEVELKRGFDLVFSVGTSSLFPYIVEPVYAAKDRGVPTVEINPGRTDVSDDVDFRIAAGAAEALGVIWKRYHAARS